jgi:hypothetical protein
MFENIEIITSRIISIWIFIITSFIFFTLKQQHETLPLFQFGPNTELFILYIPINTNIKYSFVVSFCFFNSIIRSLNHNILQSWIINEIQDTTKNNISSAYISYEISCVSTIYNWFDFFMYMHILMSQIDLLFVEITADMIMTIIITKYYLTKKNEYQIIP